MDSSRDDELRAEIEGLLRAGLATEVFPRADDGDQFQQLVLRLRTSDGSLESRLVIGGFTLEPVEHGSIPQACDNCMYYLTHTRYCVLPELQLPVEPSWSCRLWRI